MANKKSAEKRMRQAIKRRGRNRAHKSAVRSAIKQLRSVVSDGRAEEARELLPKTISLINSKAGAGVLHRNAAARTTSRLTRAVQKMES